MRWTPSAPKVPARAPRPTIEPDLLAVSLAGRQSAHIGRPDVEAGPPRPVFVLGPLRSGTSLLTLSLSQHPNLVHILETNWFEQFGMGLAQSFSAGLRFRNRSILDVAGIEIEDFFAHFGVSINQLLLESATAGLLVPGAPRTNGHADLDEAPVYRPQRWIDGTTSNAFCVFVLLRLFPNARFIHVVRDLHDVVDTLTTSETRGTYKSHYLRMPEDRAYRHWIETTRACFEAEKAFGSNVVMRIRRDDLIAAPEATLRRCFDFIAEPFSPLSLRPFSSVKTVETPRTDVGDSALTHMIIRNLRAEAEELHAELSAETPSLIDASSGIVHSVYEEDLGRIAAMEIDFSTRAQRSRSAIPTSIPGFNRTPRAQRKRPKPRAWQPMSFLRGIIERD
jgi:hypothetical protein